MDYGGAAVATGRDPPMGDEQEGLRETVALSVLFWDCLGV